MQPLTKPLASGTFDAITRTMAAVSNIIPLAEPANPVQPTQTSPQPKTTSATIRSHWFKYAGRQWRIYKRSSAADAPWYIEFYRDKARFPRSLGTSSKAHAELEAKSFIDAWMQERRDARSGLAPRQTTKFATVGDLAAFLPRLTIKASAKTRADYLANLRRVLVPALGIERAAVDDVILDRLDDRASARFFAWVETEANQLPTQADRMRFRGSWLSMYQTACALFSPRAEYQFTKTFGLVFPDLKHWRNGAKIHGPQLPRDTGPAIPEDAIVRRTLREWAKLGNTPGYECRNRDHRRRQPGGKTDFVFGPLTELDRRNMFLAIGLELSCGLRKSEVPRVKWGWLKRFHGVPHLSERDTEVKNATGEVHIVPLDPFWNFMLRVARRNNWVGSTDEPLLNARHKTDGQHRALQFSHGGHTDATYWPFTHIGWWLRDLGWDMTKTNHALRDYSASMITMRYSLADASEWCRHSSITTTQGSYNRFVQMGKRVNARALAWLRWAK